MPLRSPDRTARTKKCLGPLLYRPLSQMLHPEWYDPFGGASGRLLISRVYVRTRNCRTDARSDHEPEQSVTPPPDFRK